MDSSYQTIMHLVDGMGKSTGSLECLLFVYHACYAHDNCTSQCQWRRSNDLQRVIAVAYRHRSKSKSGFQRFILV